MWEDSELKIKLYFYPIFCFALGTLGLLNPGWESFGVVLFLLGFVISLHVILVSVIREGRRHIEADESRVKAQRDLYETIKTLDHEARYQLGLAQAPAEVKVTIDQTKKVGNDFSQIYAKLPVAPYKLKVIAQAAINGEGFTVRKWAGDGKLLSRPEWDALHAKMVELELLVPVGEDPREGFMWTSLGEDVMTQIVKDSL